MNMRLAYVLFIFSLMVAFYVGFSGPGEPPKDFRTPQSLSPESSKEEENRAPSGAFQRSPASTPKALGTKEFRRKYGDHLKWVRSRTGDLLAIQSKTDNLDDWQKNQRAGVSFSTRNREAVLKRAEEILADAREMLGLSSDYPLEFPRLSMTDFSAQVVFEETHQGVPLSQGKVSLLLGPQGELRSLESDYIRGNQITNRAPAQVGGEGRKILWVDQRTEMGATSRYAWETRESGTQIVRDAETGELILRRNRRNY